MRNRTASGKAGPLVLLVLIVLLLGGWSQSQRVADWFRLRGYNPPSEIATIAEQTTMTDEGRHLFYINRPALEDKATFRQNCPDYEATIVIGCYRQGQGGIHVLRVDEPRLEGVEQVTAAHEMLHAAFDRLSSKEKDQLEAWLADYAQNGLSDERIKGTLKSYESTEPGQQSNEMYAIFGTEVKDLPAELEQHYRKYFHDRSRVVVFASQYQQAFTALQDQVDAFDEQLNGLAARIRDNTAQLTAQREELGRSEQQLNQYRQSGEIERYNQNVDGYNRRVGVYNDLLAVTRNLINEHNQLVERRNSIAEQTVELRQAIDSDQLPQTR